MFNIYVNIINFLLLLSIIKCIVVIPFKTYIKKEPEDFKASDVIYNWGENIIYSNSFIGNPTQTISVIIHSQNFETNLYLNKCDISGSSYNKNESKSYIIEKEISDPVNSYNKGFKISETLYFYDNLEKKELKPIKDFKIVYIEKTDEYQKTLNKFHENTCINVGLTLNYVTYGEGDYNLVKQLKAKGDILETYDLSFKYISDYEGEIVIGSEPHNYDPENYYEKQYRIIGALNPKQSLYRQDYFLICDKIYYSYNNEDKNEIIKREFDPDISGRIQFDMGLILGPSQYEKFIKEDFFNSLIGEEKCFTETVIDEKYNYRYHLYYCDKKLTENIIKNEFPTLYFEIKQFSKTFELTYIDLFREKNGKIYFLVYFRENDYYANYFLMGRIFLKKYFFTFNQDTKMIGYYNEDLPGGKKKGDNTQKKSFFENKFLWIIIAILIIIFGVVGFLLGKFVYDRVRKRRLNEMEDNYDYASPEDNINDEIN